MSVKVQVGEATELHNRKLQVRAAREILARLRTTPIFVKRHSNWFALVLFGLATLIFTWPLTANLSGALFDLGDPADSSWRIGSMAYQLLHDPLHLYQSSTLYPVPNVLTLDELLTGNALLTAPLIWLTNNPVLAFNLLVFASYALSGWAVHLLTRHLTHSVGAGLVAGTIFTFSPWHYAQHGHLGIAATEWMIFALYFLILFLENRTPRRFVYLACFGLCIALQALVAGYLAYFAAIITGLYLFYYFLFEGGLISRLFWYSKLKLWRPIVTKLTKPHWLDFKLLGWQLVLVGAAGIMALLLILPFVLPFIQAQHDYVFTRGLDEVRHFSASPNGLLLATDENWLVKLKILHKQAGERALWPGLIAALLAVFGLIWGGRLKLNARRWIFGFVGIFGLVLCFGPYLNMDEIGTKPTDIALPYLWFYQHIPGFDALRVPYRFGAIFMLGLAVCAGYGVAVLQRLDWTRLLHLKLNWNVLVAVVALGLAGGEFYAPGLATQSIGMNENTPPVYQWLASVESQKIVPSDALMLELPLDTNNPINSDPIYALYNLQYRRPLLDGSANIVPNSYYRLFNEMRDFPSPRSLDVIEGTKVKFLIIHLNLLNADQHKILDTLIKTGERFDIVKSYPDTLLLKVKTSNRFAKLIGAMPPGSQIYLADDSNGRPTTGGLYTQALVNILGDKYQYFSDYQTLYNSVPQPVQQHKVYDFAVLYKGTDSSVLGYSSSDMIFANDTVEVYARPNGLEAFFDFEVGNQSGLYQAFSAAKPLRLSVTSTSVSSVDVSPKTSSDSVVNMNPNHTLTLLLAVPQPQDVIIRVGANNQILHLEAGFYRYFLDIATPQTFALSVQGADNAYLLQARLSSNQAIHPAGPQRLSGPNGLIWQVTNNLEPNTSGIVDTIMFNYNDGRPARFANASLVISVVSTDANKTALAPHQFGLWTLPIPETARGELQTLQVKLDLQKQQATALVNNMPTEIQNLPLSDLDGNYRAEIGIASPNSDLHVINRYSFVVSHVNNVAVISNVQIESPNAILMLPNSSVSK